jgi:NADH:ubiquinone oxidoreductase subunit 3 (subunit A)
MSNEKEKNESADKKESAAEGESRRGSSSAYYLVVIMLVILAVLVLVVLIMPLFFPKDLTEYYKWALAVLLGAFGAWIGAGAAYFFGKENLQESSSSTERAMRIQQESFRRPPLFERIKDMTLTALNPNFLFHFDDNKGQVITKLEDYKGYWFVPVVDKMTAVLKDIIHARVFWAPTFDDATTLEQIVSEIDKKAESKKLHGDMFYIKVSPNDKISDVYKLICQKDAEVAIVVDEQGKASHCLSKIDMRTFLKVTA